MIDLKKLREFAKEGKPMQLADIQNNELIKLLDMLEEAQEKAKRYDWLKDQHNDILSHVGVVRYEDGIAYPIERSVGVHGYDLDMAIDVAMKENE